MAREIPENSLVHRYVNIPCPGGMHETSIVTFKNHSLAVMFCIPCEAVWTVPTNHPELEHIDRDRPLFH